MRNRGLKIFFKVKKKEEKEKKKQSTTTTKKRMVVKIVKIFLGLSLVVWAVWGHFQGGSLCLTSSVCWSLQCLTSVLTQGERWTLFFFFRLTCSVAL